MEIQIHLEKAEEQGIDIPALIQSDRRVAAEWNRALREARLVLRPVREAMKVTDESDEAELAS